MSLGPIILDLRGPALADDEREILRHPRVGGVILFSRNYEELKQLRALTDGIHRLRQPPLLIGVDQEGGRVQRFRGDFTSLPACRCFGRSYDAAPAEALELVQRAGWLMAAELLAAGVDFSFAPVLDLDKGISSVIGDRAFHRDPEVVAVLAKRFMQGMRSAGMAAVGKHFPGHGSVATDSHYAVPVDRRSFEDIAMADMLAFERLISAGLPAIMPAHVVFSSVDPLPAGFSSKWIGEVLRRQLGFQGAVISDDLSMAGAEMLGDYHERAEAALRAGCDVVLACNNQKDAIKLVETLELEPNPASQVRLMRLHGARSRVDLPELKSDKEWKSAATALTALDQTPELGLGDDSIHS